MDFMSKNLRENNLKVTPQRLAIYEYLLNTKTHPTAETIHKEILKKIPLISFATVYKTLDSLRNAGLVLEFNVGEDSFRYDADTSAHPHFFCHKCSEVTDLVIPESYLNFQADVCKENPKFNFQNNEMFFFGTCCKCN